jgi:hypothetical protein
VVVASKVAPPRPQKHAFCFTRLPFPSGLGGYANYNNTAEFIALEIKNEDKQYKNSTEEKEANAFAKNTLINE